MTTEICIDTPREDQTWYCLNGRVVYGIINDSWLWLTTAQVLIQLEACEKVISDYDLRGDFPMYTCFLYHQRLVSHALFLIGQKKQQQQTQFSKQNEIKEIQTLKTKTSKSIFDSF